MGAIKDYLVPKLKSSIFTANTFKTKSEARDDFYQVFSDLASSLEIDTTGASVTLPSESAAETSTKNIMFDYDVDFSDTLEDYLATLFSVAISDLNGSFPGVTIVTEIIVPGSASGVSSAIKPIMNDLSYDPEDPDSALDERVNAIAEEVENIINGMTVISNGIFNSGGAPWVSPGALIISS